MRGSDAHHGLRNPRAARHGDAFRVGGLGSVDHIFILSTRTIPSSELGPEPAYSQRLYVRPLSSPWSGLPQHTPSPTTAFFRFPTPTRVTSQPLTPPRDIGSYTHQNPTIAVLRQWNFIRVPCTAGRKGCYTVEKQYAGHERGQWQA